MAKSLVRLWVYNKKNSNGWRKVSLLITLALIVTPPTETARRSDRWQVASRI